MAEEVEDAYDQRVRGDDIRRCYVMDKEPIVMPIAHEMTRRAEELAALGKACSATDP